MFSVYENARFPAACTVAIFTFTFFSFISKSFVFLSVDDYDDEHFGAIVGVIKNTTAQVYAYYTFLNLPK